MVLMTLNDLVEFCEKKGLTKFQSAIDTPSIRVTTRDLFSFESFEENETDDYLKLNIKACHTLVNNNRSNISKETMESALPTFANKPILADVCEYKDKKGNISYDFSGHTMQEIDDPFNSGQKRTNYIEAIVGIIPETNNIRMEKDPKSDKEYVFVDGYVFKEYGNFAADIIKARNGNVDVSVELNVEEFSFDTREKVLNIEKFTFSGITLLGENVQPGMSGAHAEAFSKNEEEKFIYNDNLMKKVENVQELITSLTKRIEGMKQTQESQTNKKGGNTTVNFEELLQKYGVTADDVTFETEGLTPEELEAKFDETFSCKGDSENNSKKKYGKKEYTISENGDMSFIIDREEFQISHEDIRCGLYGLCSSTYEDDNNWVHIKEVYDDSFVMQEYPSRKYYRQKYTKDGDNVAFDGERVQVYATYVTKDEESALEEMRSNYEELVQFKIEKEASETKMQKEEILSAEAYECLAEIKEFVQLKADIDKYSIDEISTKADLIYADFMKKQNFSSNSIPKTKKTVKTTFGTDKKETKKPYGNLFDGYDK